MHPFDVARYLLAALYLDDAYEVEACKKDPTFNHIDSFIKGHKAIFGTGKFVFDENDIAEMEAEIAKNQKIIRQNVEHIKTGTNSFSKPIGGTTSKEQSNREAIERNDIKLFDLQQLRAFKEKLELNIEIAKAPVDPAFLKPKPKEVEEEKLKDYLKTMDPNRTRAAFEWRFAAALALCGCNADGCKMDSTDDPKFDKVKCKKCGAVYHMACLKKLKECNKCEDLEDEDEEVESEDELGDELEDSEKKMKSMKKKKRNLIWKMKILNLKKK
uniref:Uncharacterized protein n=1 Tax=Panagrolaimus superbus TaxID=310955 RepID=A0A914Y296_9BILA